MEAGKYIFDSEKNRSSRWSEEEWQEMWKVLVLLPVSYGHPHPDGLQTSKTPVKSNTLSALQTYSPSVAPNLMCDITILLNIYIRSLSLFFFF